VRPGPPSVGAPGAAAPATGPSGLLPFTGLMVIRALIAAAVLLGVGTSLVLARRRTYRSS